jgi:hypothetical protein
MKHNNETMAIYPELYMSSAHKAMLIVLVRNQSLFPIVAVTVVS